MSGPTPLFDSHCHLTHDRFAKDLDEVLDRMRTAGMVRALCIGTGIADAQQALAIAARAPDLISVAAGLDPFTCHRLGDDFAAQLDALDELAATQPIAAIGEIGLDYHYELNGATVQQEQLHRQLQLAEVRDLPVVIHVREAHADMQAVLGEHPRVRGVIHSFTSGPADAEAYLALGWYLAYNGVATFKNAPEVRDAAALTPADRLLVETDSPYLAPIPLRGKRCEPAYVAHTVVQLAEVRGERADDVAAWSCKNAAKLFRIPAAWPHD